MYAHITHNDVREWVRCIEPSSTARDKFDGNPIQIPRLTERTRSRLDCGATRNPTTAGSAHEHIGDTGFSEQLPEARIDVGWNHSYMVVIERDAQSQTSKGVDKPTWSGHRREIRSNHPLN
jgi:hypothetical protein